MAIWERSCQDKHDVHPFSGKKLPAVVFGAERSIDQPAYQPHRSTVTPDMCEESSFGQLSAKTLTGKFNPGYSKAYNHHSHRTKSPLGSKGLSFDQCLSLRMRQGGLYWESLDFASLESFVKLDMA